VVDAPAGITDGLAGEVRYDSDLNDVTTAGEYLAWFHVTYSNGKEHDAPEFLIEIRAHTTANQRVR
jgi:hypothetical protein